MVAFQARRIVYRHQDSFQLEDMFLFPCDVVGYDSRVVGGDFDFHGSNAVRSSICRQ